MSDPIFERTSVRQYLDKPVEGEKIERLLRAGMQAPSAMNQKPWEFYVVTNKEIKAKLGHVTPFARPCLNAPLVIVPMMKTKVHLSMFRIEDISASVENILLEATELGLGAVWMGVAPLKERMKMIEDILGNPEGLEAFCLVAIGYPSSEHEQVSRFDETRVHYLK